MAERGVTVHVTTLAKWKTTTQMLAVLALLGAHAEPGFEPLLIIGERLLWLATGLTLYTGWQYWQGSKHHLK
jgi:phosphatidylglycerophosphate synthase